MMRIRNMLFLPLAVFLLYSCGSSKNISYFQDLPSGESERQMMISSEIKIRPKDKISIIVNSKDPLLADLFNLPILSRQIGLSSLTSSSGNNYGISGYTVDAEGTIDFPVLGKIRVEGMDKQEISAYIKNELIEKNLVKDPVVTVEFLNLTLSVLGEVAEPGRYSIDRDKITLLDALSMAGDLTIYGKRENVLVLREENGVKKAFRVDIRSAEQLFSSPVYYLQQNDVVYVEPNLTRARQSTVNGNNVVSTSFWLSIASLLATITVLFVK